CNRNHVSRPREAIPRNRNIPSILPTILVDASPPHSGSPTGSGSRPAVGRRSGDGHRSIVDRTFMSPEVILLANSETGGDWAFRRLSAAKATLAATFGEPGQILRNTPLVAWRYHPPSAMLNLRPTGAARACRRVWQPVRSVDGRLLRGYT